MFNIVWKEFEFYTSYIHIQSDYAIKITKILPFDYLIFTKKKKLGFLPQKYMCYSFSLKKFAKKQWIGKGQNI